jgi:uncharacterized membrane protein
MTTCTHAIVGVGDYSPVLFRLLGRFHPGIVHFPIALLAVAAALELWQIVRRKPGLASATPVCLLFGAVSAVVASFFGWCLDAFDGAGGDLVALHKWVGIASAALGIVAAVLVGKAAASPRALVVLRLAVLTGAGLAGATGYLGGELVFGRNHMFKGIFDENKTEHALASTGGSPAAHPDREQLVIPVGKVDFTKNVVAILKDNCLRCHGGEKIKGKLNLKTKPGAMKGGQSGGCILPGQPDKSMLYTMLIETDPDMKMPPSKEKQLVKEQVETIRKWIEQGADWPDGVELQ